MDNEILAIHPKLIFEIYIKQIRSNDMSLENLLSNSKHQKLISSTLEERVVCKVLRTT